MGTPFFLYSSEVVVEKDVPENMKEMAKEKRLELIENLADIDETMEEIYLNEQEPTIEQVKEAIRIATLKLKFVPVYMGSAYHNKSVQPLLDGVIDYLPAPHMVENYALDTENSEKEFLLSCKVSDPFIGLSFKLEESRFGQLTYLRIYQGTIRRGDSIVNVRTNKKVKVPRLVRMHSADMEDVESVGSGEICALFGVDCARSDPRV